MKAMLNKKRITAGQEAAWGRFCRQYGHIFPLIIYGIFYILCFAYLESKPMRNMHLIHMAVDDYIPFCEYFIIPYFLWFGYVAAAVVFFFFQDKGDYYRLCTFLFTGMTIFLAVSAIYPNGHLLRPVLAGREDTIFIRMVRFLYKADTATNLFPSIHVYNSLATHFAITNSSYFENKKWIRTGSLILCISIILSTVFLKQHSMFDVLTAFGLAAVMHFAVYRRAAVAYPQTAEARPRF